MKLFHGSPFRISSLKSSNETGNIRKGEEGRKELRDVVFMSISHHEARNYAGKNGYVYVVEVGSARPLCEIPHDKDDFKRSASIWVAYPKDIKIVRVICSDGSIRNPFRERILLG